MQRDMDLIRKILFAVERFPVSIDGRSMHDLSVEHNGTRMEDGNQILFGHILILRDAELINAAISPRLMEARVFRLTWKGHEFLDAARDDDVSEPRTRH